MTTRLSPLLNLALFLFSCTIVEGDQKRKNIILLVLDDVGWGDVGFHGSNFKTPQIDALAYTGVRLERMYTSPMCSPSRASIMTGRYAHKLGMQHYSTLMPGSRAGLPKDARTLAEIMTDEGGYESHAIGKWHLGAGDWSQTPTERGFLSHVGYLQGVNDYFNHSTFSCAGICLYRSNCKQFSKDNKMRYLLQLRQAGSGRNAEAGSTNSGNTSAKKPLFIYFAQQLLHLPLHAPPGHRHMDVCRSVSGGTEVANRTVLCAMASKLDETVGAVASAIKAAGIWNDTIVWVVSDNGGVD
eukprot:jgi/Bigna1/37549/e_gw1.20.70.1